MKEDFYTFGGSYFWEDVFFYQKWRIQRNHTSKKFRLLDNWDIRRFEGSFEECRKAFVKYINAFEITRQKGHMVIMIHSLGQGKNFFKPLWREVLKHNFLAAALNYPSTQKNVAGHVRQFHFFMNHLEDVEEVSFVTYGAGNLILQKLFAENAEWQTKLKIRRAVLVNPCVYGNRLISSLCKNKFFSFLIGPMGMDLAPKNSKKYPPLNKVETGVVLIRESFIMRVFKFLFRSSSAKKSPSEIKDDIGAKDVSVVRNLKFDVFKNEQISSNVVKFLQHGKF